MGSARIQHVSVLGSGKQSQTASPPPFPGDDCSCYVDNPDKATDPQRIVKLKRNPVAAKLRGHRWHFQRLLPSSTDVPRVGLGLSASCECKTDAPPKLQDGRCLIS